MNRVEILSIYRESTYDNNTVRDGFALAEKVPDSAALIFIPNAADGTMVRILRQVGLLQDIYVSEPVKHNRMLLHRMRNVKLIDDRDIKDIDLIRTCGQYKKFPGCKGCKSEPASCKEFLGLPNGQFDVVISLDKDLDIEVLRKHSGNVILLESKDTDRKAEEQIEIHRNRS